MSLSEGNNDGWLDNPRKVAYIRLLVETLYESRTIVVCYNAAILRLLSAFALLHWGSRGGGEPTISRKSVLQAY
jgi:hypothetical protein